MGMGDGIWIRPTTYTRGLASLRGLAKPTGWGGFLMSSTLPTLDSDKRGNGGASVTPSGEAEKG